MDKEKKIRTLTQNKALHRFFELLATELADAGLDAKKVLKEGVDIPFTPAMVKELLWKPTQELMFKRRSTADLTTDEVSKVYEVIDKHLGQMFGIHVDFPSSEE